MPRSRGKRTRIATGVYQDAIGIAVVAMVGGLQREKRLKAGTSLHTALRERDALRDELRRKARLRQRRKPLAGTLAFEAPRYLQAVKAMASYKSRVRQIEMWVAVLGKKKLADLDHLTIAAQLHRWRTEPRSEDDPRPYSVQYCLHLRTALSHLFETVDPDADNPVARVARLRPPDPAPRAIPVPDLLKLLRAWPVGSKKNRARLMVMAATGLGQKELMRVRPEDVQLEAGLLIAQARRKGRGAEARAVPLTRHALRALRFFVKVDAFGAFSTSNLRRDFRLAAEAAGYVLKDGDHPDGIDWRPYDARHTFGTEVGRLARDERAVQQLLGHSDIRTTRRYTMGSVDPRVMAAITALNGRVPETGARNARRKVAESGGN